MRIKLTEESMNQAKFTGVVKKLKDLSECELKASVVVQDDGSVDGYCGDELFAEQEDDDCWVYLSEYLGEYEVVSEEGNGIEIEGFSK